jgi:hypothetical protein
VLFGPEHAIDARKKSVSALSLSLPIGVTHPSNRTVGATTAGVCISQSHTRRVSVENISTTITSKNMRVTALPGAD